MHKIIYRTIGNKTHVLNVSTGTLMTFEMTEAEMLHVFQNRTDPRLGLDAEVLSLFASKMQTNTRLCRDNLNSLGMEFEFPTTVNIEINRRCSLRCLHCYIGTKDLKSSNPSVFEQMSRKQLSMFLDKLHKMGVFLLVLTGGEPFLNKKLEQFLWLAKAKGFVVELFSNLQQIPSWFWKLSPTTAMIGRIQVSIYSSDPIVHDRITTIKGSHKKSMNNLCELKRLGFYVEVATPLMKYNFDSWEETRKLFASLKIKQDFSWPIVDEYYSRKTGKSSLNIMASQFAKFVEKNPDFLIRTKFTKTNTPICEAGRSMFSISANGDVFPCSQFPSSVGSICDATPQAIYDSKRMRWVRSLKNIDVGLDMAYNYCVGENYVETGNPLTQSPFFLVSISKALKRKGGNES